MRTLYLNPSSGIAGDMTVGALLDLNAQLGSDPSEFWETLRSLPLPAEEWQTDAESVMRHGIQATHFRVHALEPGHHHHHAHSHGEENGHSHSDKDGHSHGDKNGHSHGEDNGHSHGQDGHHHHHHHRHLPEIRQILTDSALPVGARERAIRSFEVLAEAEGSVHNIPPEKVHFHEVGAVDAIVDIAAACLALELLQVERVSCDAIALGSGTVTCEHGEMPVPVPAVTRLLEGVPTVLGSASGELTTPTGAALLRGFGATFGGQPAGRLIAAGYGAGTKDFPHHANVLQALLLETADSDEDADTTPNTIAVIECNLDDLPGEQAGYLIPRLLDAGALDVSLLPCTMKKGRPGLIVQVMSPLEKRGLLADLLLRESSSFGVRWYTTERLMLRREVLEVETAYGPVQVKLGYHPESGELVRLAPEYESCRSLAESARVPLEHVYSAARDAARPV